MMKVVLFVLILWGGWLLLRPRRTGPVLGEAEARATLGVGPDADADTIRAAHRRLVQAVHPDKGGSTELARRINAARDVLLRR